MITFPASLLIGEGAHPRLVTSGVTPGRGLDGRRQVIFRENRYWAASFLVIDAWDDNAGPFLAFLDDCQGMAISFNLPITNGRTPTYQGTEYGWAKSLGLSDDEAREGAIYVPPLADGQPWSWLPLPEHNYTYAAASAVAGSSLITLTGYIGQNLAVGSYFSINDYLYRVAANAAGSIRFNPPLREAVASGQFVRTNDPRIRVTFADDAAQQAAHDAAQWGGPFTMSVVESFER